MTQAELGPWPMDHPLPLPRWAQDQPPVYHADTLMHYEKMAGCVEMHVQRLLEEHNYNTLGNFVDLYEGYKGSGGAEFYSYFTRYVPNITPEHHTCVGLALELFNRLRHLDSVFTDLSRHFYLVSCEESIEALDEYTALSDNLETAAYELEKEHVLLCLKFQIGERHGLLLCDPGYHVARVVTVMTDKAYPHTDWFMQSEEGDIRKEYNYHFSHLNDSFVEWHERTTRNETQRFFTGLIYVGRPYLTAVDVTERRNLVYNFRSLLSRDQKGHLIAGIYFKVKENVDEFTMFYQDMGKQRVKMRFSHFLDMQQMSPKTVNIVTICNEQLNLPEGGLMDLLKRTALLMDDKWYLRQLLEVNENINVMSANN